MEQAARNEAFSAIAGQWEAAGIRYGIINGYSEVSQETGRDLDIAMAAQDAVTASWIASEELRSRGWLLKADHRPWAWWIFAFRKIGNITIGLEVDLLPRLQSGINCLQCGVSQYTRQIGHHGWQVDSRGSLIKRILLQVVAGNDEKFNRQPELLWLSASEQAVLLEDRKLRWIVGDMLVPDASRLSVANFAQTRAALKRRLYAAAVRSPLNALGTLPFGVSRSWGLNVLPRRVAPVIEISAAAGIDKASIIELLCARLQRATFLKPVVLDGRDGPLSHLKHIRQKCVSGGQVKGLVSACRASMISGWLRAVRVLIGAWLQNRFIVDRRSVRLYPVVIDRIVEDMLTNIHDFGASGVSEWLRHHITRPDLKIGLVAGPAIILTHGSDLSDGRTTGECATIRHLESTGYIDEVIEVNADLEGASERIFELVMDRFLGNRYNTKP